MDKIREAEPQWPDAVKARRDALARDGDLAWNLDKLRAISRVIEERQDGHTLGAAVLWADENRVASWMEIDESR